MSRTATEAEQELCALLEILRQSQERTARNLELIRESIESAPLVTVESGWAREA